MQDTRAQRSPVYRLTGNNCSKQPVPTRADRSEGRRTTVEWDQRTDQIETGRAGSLLSWTEVDWAGRRWSGRRWRRGTARSWACGSSSPPRPGRSLRRRGTWRWCSCTPTPSSAACRACCGGWRRASRGGGTPPSPSTCAGPGGPRGGHRSRAPPRSGTSPPYAGGSPRTSGRAASSSSDPPLVGLLRLFSPILTAKPCRNPYLFLFHSVQGSGGNRSNGSNNFSSTEAVLGQMEWPFTWYSLGACRQIVLDECATLKLK